jgi:hypothetical protein
MGRPPIGKVAMSGAERTRLYRLKRAADTPVTKPDAAEMQQARARIAALEAEVAALKAKLAGEAKAKVEVDRSMLSMTAQQKVDVAIRQHQRNLDRAFEQGVNEEVRRRIDAADDATRAQNKKLRAENLQYQSIMGNFAVFTKAQYRQMLMLCHPDNSASPELKAKLLQVLVENERRLVKPDGKAQR